MTYWHSGGHIELLATTGEPELVFATCVGALPTGPNLPGGTCEWVGPVRPAGEELLAEDDGIAHIHRTHGRCYGPRACDGCADEHTRCPDCGRPTRSISWDDWNTPTGGWLVAGLHQCATCDTQSMQAGGWA